LIYRI